MSAFNTRTDKNPNMFVRTHVAFYFVSLLLSDILQGESLFVHNSHCISSSFRSHKFNHELGVGARRCRRIWLVMHSTRWAWRFNYLVLANALSRCPQAHVGCRYCSLVSLLGRVRKFFDRFILGLWYGSWFDLGNWSYIQTTTDHCDTHILSSRPPLG